MNGHIVQRTKGNGAKPPSWSIVMELGTNAEGKRQQKWLSFRGTKTEAKEELRRLQHEAENGVPITYANTRVSEFFDSWLEIYAKPHVSPKTYERYAGLVANHISPSLGHVPVSKLTAMHVQQFYIQCRTSGRLNGEGGLSERTILHMHSVLHLAFKHAVQWQLIQSNPIDGVVRPRPTPTEMQYLSEEEAASWLQSAEATKYGEIVRFALQTGARRGEILALRWSDIDFEGGGLSIRRSLEQTSGGTLRFKEPKTKRSKRRIDLDSDYLARLRRLKVQQAQDRLLFGPDYQDNGLVFCKPDGTPLLPDSVSTWFKAFAARLGRPELRLHDLRHTHATILLSHNTNPKVVSERLGHSTIALTMDTYSHCVPTLQEDAARVIGRALNGGA